jgi:hypothetical protein
MTFWGVHEVEALGEELWLGWVWRAEDVAFEATLSSELALDNDFP